jgi:hypothetical protein
MGYPGVYTFTTVHQPLNASSPITYAWDNGDVTFNTVRTLAPGPHDLMVVGRNCRSAVVMDTHTIEIRPCMEVTSVGLRQVTTDAINTGTEVAFEADVVPDDASKPYTYTIDYDDGISTTASSSADPLPELMHTFASSGTYDVGIAVWNCAMAEPVTDMVAVNVSGGCVALTEIVIQGDKVGYPGVYTFTTAYQPPNASPPILYAWDNGDAMSTTVRPLGIGARGVGAYTLAVTATNCRAAWVTATHTIDINNRIIYLPLVIRNH